jgi:hypothetical protein
LGRGRFAAIELDPTYAPAHAGLALACCVQTAMRMAAPAQAYNDAGVAALHTLAMDNSCADAQVALGAVLFFSEWNWAGAGLYARVSTNDLQTLAMQNRALMKF